MELKPLITQRQYQELVHFEYKDLWKQCTEDLFYTTHCHSCGCFITAHSSVYSGHCSKGCWRGWDEIHCAFGRDCKRCKTKNYKPTLANAARICFFHGLNPMGDGKKHCLYGIGIDKMYSTHSTS